MENHKNQIMNCFADSSINSLKICQKAYDILVEANSSEILEFFFEKIDLYLRENVSAFEEEEKRLITECQKKYASLLNELLATLFSERYGVQEFYNKLWENITQMPAFDASENRKIILWMLSVNPCIPYYKPDVLHSMSDEAFEEYTEQLTDSIVRARSIIFQGYRGCTEQSSALLNLLEHCAGLQEREVLLEHIIHLIQNQEKNKVIDQIKKKLSDSMREKDNPE